MEKKHFPLDFKPGPNDVIIGRHQKLKESHTGNLKLKALTDAFLEEYKRSAEDKNRKSEILAEIYAKIHAEEGIFVKFDSKCQQFYEAEKSVAREGISQGFRDLLKDNYRSSLSFKKHRRMAKEGRVAAEDSTNADTTANPPPLEIPQPSTTVVVVAPNAGTNALTTTVLNTPMTTGTAATPAPLDATDSSKSLTDPQPQANTATTTSNAAEANAPSDIKSDPTTTTDPNGSQPSATGETPANAKADVVQHASNDIQAEEPVPKLGEQSSDMPAIRTLNKAIVPKPTKDVPFLPRDGVLLLDAEYEPHDHDVIVGLRKKSAEHAGNQNLVRIVQGFLEEYKAAGSNKNFKSKCLDKVAQVMSKLDPPAKFVKLESIHKNWYELEVFYAREKISQTFRDIAKEGYRSAITNKNERRRRSKSKTSVEAEGEAKTDDDKSKSKKGPPKKRAIRAPQSSAALTPGKIPPGSASKLVKKEQLAKQIEELKKQMELLDSEEDGDDKTDKIDDAAPNDKATNAAPQEDITAEHNKESATAKVDTPEPEAEVSGGAEQVDGDKVEANENQQSTRRSKRGRAEDGTDNQSTNVSAENDGSPDSERPKRRQKTAII